MKRLLSLLVAIVMVIAMVPVTFAAGNVGGTPDVGLWDVEEITDINLTANLVAGDDNGCYYLWTATEDGKMIVTSSADAGYAYNIVMSKGETVISGTALELDVVKGDEVMIQVVATGEGFPAGTVTVTGAYYVEPPVEPETGIVINAQPADIEAIIGNTYTLTIDATNVVSYLWQFTKDGSSWRTANSWSGYKTATMTVKVDKEDYFDWQFRCILTDAEGNTVESNIVGVNPKAAAFTSTKITTGKIVPNMPVGIRVDVTGATAASYRWYRLSPAEGASWTACSSDMTGFNAKTLRFRAYDNRAGYQYKCKIWDEAGAFTWSDTYTLVFDENPMKPTQQPGTVYAIEGKTATFTFEVEGAAYYQWQTSRNGVNFYNTQLPTYNQSTFNIVAWASRAGLYVRCVATHADGFVVTSEPAQLLLEESPIIVTMQPEAVTCKEGDTVTFSVIAGGFVGAENYTWQYSKDGGGTWYNYGSTNGGKTDTLTLPSVAARYNRWKWRCYMTDTPGHYTYSAEVRLIVE